jgi:hypothetical protein
MSVRTRLTVAACLTAVSIGALIGHARMDADLATLSQPKPVTLPYCAADDDVPTYFLVVGPAGGVITVDGKRVGELTPVEGDYADEVAPDAGPYDGLLYNVRGPGLIAVDGIECARP